jgi:tetratricopeptide (TPR) repeat protein
MVSASRTIGLLICFVAVAPAARGTEAIPQGKYQTDIWGKIDLGVEDGRLVGHATAGNPCGFAQHFTVLEGALQGRVLVGQYSVCLQGGKECPRVQVLPVLGFYNPEEGSMTAFVRTQKGCLSPVLGQEGLVVLRSPEAMAASAEAARTSPAGGRPSKRNPEGAKGALERGDRLLRERKWGDSVVEFERSIALGEQSWVVYFGLGTAQLMRHQIGEAIANLRRAQDINKREPSIAYHLACAHSRLGDKKQALFFLEQAVRLGYALNEGTQDLGLEGLLASDPLTVNDYSQNIRQAFKNAQEPARRRQAQRP